MQFLMFKVAFSSIKTLIDQHALFTSGLNKIALGIFEVISFLPKKKKTGFKLGISIYCTEHFEENFLYINVVL